MTRPVGDRRRLGDRIGRVPLAAAGITGADVARGSTDFAVHGMDHPSQRNERKILSFGSYWAAGKAFFTPRMEAACMKPRAVTGTMPGRPLLTSAAEMQFATHST